MSDILKGLYPQPFLNGFRGESAAMYSQIYIMIGVLFLLGCCFCGLRRGRGLAAGPFDPKKSALGLVTAFFVIITVFQTLGHMLYFQMQHAKIRSLSAHEKRSLFFGGPYNFSRELLRNFPGTCRGVLVSDLDTSVDPGSTALRIIAYALLPKVNLRAHEQTPPECIVYFNKENARDAVPENYVVAYEVNENNLLAVRKNP